jgi:hypothetical protein
LNGDYRRPSEWIALAAAAGLTVHSPHFNSTDWPATPDRNRTPPYDRLLIIAENVIHLGPADSVPWAIRCAAMQVATTAQAPLLELDFLQDEFSNWIFQRAQACADLLAAGDAALDAIASLVLDTANAKALYQTSYFSLSPFLPEIAIHL